MKIQILLSALLTMGSLSAQAADISGLTVTGEVAFDYSFLSTKDVDMNFTDGVPNEEYRFKNAQVLIHKETDQIQFYTRLNYTPTNFADVGATENSTADFGTLDQVEIYYKAMPNLYLGFGRLLTTMGYESLMKYENAMYTSTIAYQSIVPGYGEGLRAKYVAGDWLTANLSTYNQVAFGGWGDDYSPTKTTEMSLTGKAMGFTWFGGYYFGTDIPTSGRVDRSGSSVWASYQITENFLTVLTYDSLNTKPDGGSEAWSDSTALYLTYGLGMNNLSLRYEMVRGANELGYTAADTVNSLVLSDKIVMNDYMNLYVEYRMDKANEEAFVDGDGAATDSASLLTLSALAHF